MLSGIKVIKREANNNDDAMLKQLLEESDAPNNSNFIIDYHSFSFINFLYRENCEKMG